MEGQTYGRMNIWKGKHIEKYIHGGNIHMEGTHREIYTRKNIHNSIYT